MLSDICMADMALPAQLPDHSQKVLTLEVTPFTFPAAVAFLCVEKVVNFDIAT